MGHRSGTMNRIDDTYIIVVLRWLQVGAEQAVELYPESPVRQANEPKYVFGETLTYMLSAAQSSQIKSRSKVDQHYLYQFVRMWHSQLCSFEVLCEVFRALLESRV